MRSGTKIAIALAGTLATLSVMEAARATSAVPQHERRAVQPGMPQHMFLTPDRLRWTDAPPSLPPGAKIAVVEGDLTVAAPYTVRLRFPDGYRIPPHFHPVDEHVTVLQGTFSL